MSNDADLPLDLSEKLQRIRARTPARILVGRAGAGYRTSTQIQLRQAHAVARDAVGAELDLEVTLGGEFVRKWNLFEVRTEARCKRDFLLQPGRGRLLNQQSREQLARRCTQGNDIQIAIGDGLSVLAISRQVPALLPLLCDKAGARGWSIGNTFVIRYCRVGILNDIGELLGPKVAILLIGERPGLATADSLSAYLAFQPRAGHNDADRNLISNIHARGVSPEAAAGRILNLAADMMQAGAGGIGLKESLGSVPGQFPRG